MRHSTWIVHTVRHREVSWSDSPRPRFQQGSAAMSPMSWSSHKVKRSVSASLAGEVFMMSEGLAECEWISGVLESAVYQDYEPSLHRRKSISLPVEPTATVMKADSHLQIDPSTVCHRCEKCFRSSATRIDGRSLQTDSTRIMRDQKEHADTEGQVQMGYHTSGWLLTPSRRGMGKVLRCCDCCEMVSCQS